MNAKIYPFVNLFIWLLYSTYIEKVEKAALSNIGIKAKFYTGKTKKKIGH